MYLHMQRVQSLTPAKAVVGTEKRTASTGCMIMYNEDVDQTVTEGKDAGNTKDACNMTRRYFAALKDAWWNDHVGHLQRVVDAGDTKLVHHLLV